MADILLIVYALFIDCIQGMMTFGTFALGSMFILGVPFGLAIGFIINFALSATFGSGLLLLLGMSGNFSAKIAIPGVISEMLPGFSNLPGWTTMVLSCILRKKVAALVGAVGGAAGGFAEAVSTAQPAGAARQGMTTSPARTAGTPGREQLAPQEVGRESAAQRSRPMADIRAPRQPASIVRPLAAAAIILCMFLSTGTPARAQSIGIDQSPTNYIISPETPGPNQLVYIEAQAVGSFIGSANITWKQDGKTVLSGVGATKFTFTTGGVGSNTTIHVTIQSPTNGTFTRDFFFAPSQVNLVWEADTSAPAFFAGKPFYSAGSQVRVTAFPVVVAGPGGITSADKLSYQWTQNDQLDTTQSGLGRQTFTITGRQVQTSEDVSVDVYLGQLKVGHSEIVIPAHAPQIVLYARDPLLGIILSSGLSGTASLAGKEVTLQAEPYFFENSSLQNGNIAYSWTLNGQETTGPNSAAGSLTLRQTGTGAGGATVGVSMQNTDSTMYVQAANTVLQILFGQTTAAGSSLFGL